MGVPGGGAVGNDGDGLVGGMGGEVFHFDVQHRGQATQALGADAQAIDLVEQLQAQFFGPVFAHLFLAIRGY